MSLASPHLSEELLGDPCFSRLKEYLIESTGLAYYSDKDADLARRLRRRLSCFGLQDCASYLDRLRDSSRGPAEMDALIAEITIGETYFFRHLEHFDALRDLVLPDLIARNAGSRQLRIWSAGCADGAEAYSLSILLRRDLAHLLIGWDVSILGTDINRRCLASARTGRFEEWSFRATPPELRQACFEEKGKHWTIAPEYKAGVSFQFHNLVENAFPTQAGDSSAFDLIICRNVMIYFGPELMRRMVRQFHDCMAPGAWLIVGPSEPNMAYFTLFRPVNAPGVTLYQRPTQSAPNCVETTASRALPLPPPPPHAASTLAQTTAPIAATTKRPVPTLHDMRHCADRGDWEGAGRCGKELLIADNLNPMVHFHYALVMEQMGDLVESEQSLRRAIYLDRRAVLAHHHLGLRLQSRGELRQALRSFENAMEVLASQSGDSILPDADGITVADLSQMTRIRVEALRIEMRKEQS